MLNVYAQRATNPDDMEKHFNAHWVSAGKISVKGHPHHPLYLKKDSLLDDFDMESYQKRFAE